MQLKKGPRGFYLCIVLLLALAIGDSAITYADSGTATVAVKAGSLTESNATNNVSLKVSKKVTSISYVLPITVTDARGSGGGWKLSITSTTFKITNDNKDRLPTNVSRIVSMSASCNAHSTCTLPINSITYPVGVPAGKTPPPAVKFFDATVGSGLGNFLLSMMVNVSIPAQTEAGTYTSTITLAIANGP